MADYAENVQSDHSDSDSDNGRVDGGPSLFSLNQAHFLLPIPAGGEIGGRRIPAVPRAMTSRSVTVGPASVADRASPALVPKLEPVPEEQPIGDIEMAEVPAAAPAVPAPAAAPAAAAAGDDPAADANIYDASPEPEAKAAAATAAKSEKKTDNDDDVPVIVSGREILDPRGDIILVAGSEDNIHEFRVCSRALFRHSQQLESLCRGDVDAPRRFRSRTPDSNDPRNEEPRRVRIALSITNMEALHMLLILLHHSPNERIYAMLKGRKLFSDVLVIAHHFEMVPCISAIAPRWLKEVYRKDIARFDEVWHQLWICHILGHLPCVKQTILRMVSHARLNSRDELLGFGAQDDQPFSSFAPLKALEILDDIAKCRLDVMNKLRSLVENAINALSDSPKTTPLRPNGGHLCRAIDEGEGVRRRCDKLLLGNLHSELRANRWNNQDLRGSPFSLHKRITMIAKRAVEACRPDDWKESTDCHSHCLPFGDVWPSLDTIINEEIEKIDFGKEAFAARAATLGFRNVNWG